MERTGLLAGPFHAALDEPEFYKY
ncbi:hypothetical protein B14911_22887 [Bacillus sp. NRRL B-14911]|nr:hypothetical protein B14911_22887 [Bacillus sp. NRRL B-14911]